MSISWAAHRTRLLLIIAAAVLDVAGLLALTSQGASARASGSRAFHGSGPKPVIVLEHGAWADGSSWDRVIRRLQNAGFTVYAPPNPLRGLPSDSAYLPDFLTQNAALAGRPVILFAHSYRRAPRAWNPLPSWAVPGPAARLTPPALLQSRAHRAGPRITDVTAGHLSLIPRADTVARVILRAASATS